MDSMETTQNLDSEQLMMSQPVNPNYQEEPINSEDYKVLSFTKDDYHTLEKITKEIDKLCKYRLIRKLKNKEAKIQEATKILESYILYTYHVAKYYGESIIVGMVYSIFDNLTFDTPEYANRALILYSKAVHYSFFIKTFERYEVSDIYNNYGSLKDFVKYVNDTSIAYNSRLNFKSRIASFVKSMYLDIIRNYITRMKTACEKDLDKKLKDQVQNHIDTWQILKSLFDKELKTAFDNNKDFQIAMVCRVLQILIMITLKSTEWIVHAKAIIKQVSWDPWLDSYINNVETLVSKI